MTQGKANDGDLKEKLAEIEHIRWADWQKWMHKCMAKEVNYDGKTVYTLSEEQIFRWERQITTKYPDLSETEKQSDRDQVDRYWPLIQSLLERRRIDTLKEAKQIVLRRTEIPKDARNPTRDQTVIIGEACADAIQHYIDDAELSQRGEAGGGKE